MEMFKSSHKTRPIEGVTNYLILLGFFTDSDKERRT